MTVEAMDKGHIRPGKSFILFPYSSGTALPRARESAVVALTKAKGRSAYSDGLTVDAARMVPMPTLLPKRVAVPVAQPAIGIAAWIIIPLALAVLTLSLARISPVPYQVAADAGMIETMATAQPSM